MSRFALLTAVAVQVLAVLAMPSKRADHLSCKGADFESNGIPDSFILDTTGVATPDNGIIYAAVVIEGIFDGAPAAYSSPSPHNNANIKLRNDLLIYNIGDKLTSGSTYNVRCQANWYDTKGDVHAIQPGYFTFKYQA